MLYLVKTRSSSIHCRLLILTTSHGWLKRRVASTMYHSTRITTGNFESMRQPFDSDLLVLLYYAHISCALRLRSRILVDSAFDVQLVCCQCYLGLLSSHHFMLNSSHFCRDSFQFKKSEKITFHNNDCAALTLTI